MQRPDLTPRLGCQRRTGPCAAVRLSRALGRAAAPLLGFLLGCGADPPTQLPDQLQPGTVRLAKVDWLSPPAPLGQVAAVIDTVEDVAVYSDAGVAIFTGGSLRGSDTSVRTWRAAAVVPALGYAGTWMLGVDGGGLLYRLRNSMVLEDVTTRYALGQSPVREVTLVSPELVAFGLSDQLALADGLTVKKYALALHGLVGGGGRIAALDDSGVTSFEPRSGVLRHLTLAGVIATALDQSGRLWAATSQALYAEQSDGLTLAPVYQAAPGEAISGLAASPGALWVALGNTLAIVRGMQLLHGQADLVPAGARITASASGDVWALSNGQLSRVGEESGGGADQVFWRQHLLPIYQRVCQSCHQTGGSSRIDLSTYSAWAMRRALVEQRVIAQVPTPMPPAGTGTLTATELADVRTWVTH